MLARHGGDRDTDLARSLTTDDRSRLGQRDIALASVDLDKHQGSVHATAILSQPNPFPGPTFDSGAALPHRSGRREPLTHAAMHDTAIPLLKQRPAITARTALVSTATPDRGGAPVRSLYIHVPFCFHKCHYCDFYSIVDTRDRQQSFLARLETELEAMAPWAAGVPLLTVFVGGGTPSLLRRDLWERLLKRLGELFDLSLMGGDRAGEFTVECNPETVSAELMHTLHAGGVTRVSVGAQSFDRHQLKTLERWHDPENVPRAIELARQAGIARQSVDLIFGIPGQSLDAWRADLERALGLGTEHLSCYNLTYEPGTAMTARLKRGEFQAADEDLEVEMYRLTLDTLRGRGLERYEVSNYSRPGQECRHNLAYWRQEQWLATGPSASAHVGGQRWKNIARLDDYLSVSENGFAPITDFEAPDPRRGLSERIMTGLRLGEGLDSRPVLEAAERLDPNAPARLGGVARRNADNALLADSDDRWILTDEGFLLADGIVLEFMEALDAPL